jgi:hypothetical protein
MVRKPLRLALLAGSSWPVLFAAHAQAEIDAKRKRVAAQVQAALLPTGLA